MLLANTFLKRAKIELINQSNEPNRQYFYIDYETYDSPQDNLAYAHAEFRRANPFDVCGPEIEVNTPQASIVNKGRDAWNKNYVILETEGSGHYLGCNLSVTTFAGSWWGEGDDMIWIDVYKWPPDPDGTGNEDYFN